MSNTTKTRARKPKAKRPHLSEFQNRLADVTTSYLDFAVTSPPSPGARAALAEAITRYAVVPASSPPRLRRGCPHARQGEPTILLLDETEPKVRCATCAVTDTPPLLDQADLDICRICGTGNKRFQEYVIMVPGQNLTVAVNCCELCARDLGAA